MRIFSMSKMVFKLVLMCTLVLFTTGCDTLGTVVGTAVSAAVGYGIYALTKH